MLYIPLGSHDVLVGNTEEVTLFIGEWFTFFCKFLHGLVARVGVGGRKTRGEREGGRRRGKNLNYWFIKER